ncbi:ABC transporter [Streptomyces sp. CB03911]|uniref:ABC transporter n=1 Tax=Streptomyces sp. CB03911 TaxID=1804758 RepID=UPI00093DFB48|nr:ABC transporter [Streptomyces sp. CB03911]OKI22581.1 ABC transporter [Streptomyces sp. CB03911]
MRALIRYQAELLLRSYGWLPPFLAYALLMVVGVSIGDPLLGSQAVGAAVLLPVTAWLVRVVVTAEPAASRACLAAAATGPRVQLAALLTALSAGLLLAAGGTVALLVASGPVGNPGAPPAPVGEALVAGFLASVVCVLLGVAVGALCNRPVLLRGQYGIPLALAAATLVLVAPSSPANAAVRELVDASRSGRVGYPWAALAVAGLLLAAAAAGACGLAGRRTE